MASNASSSQQTSLASSIILDHTSQSTQQYSQQNSQLSSQQNINSRYNNPDFQLKDNDIYIFENSLFTRILQPIDHTKERELLIQCITCSYKKIEKVAGFQSLNYVAHYKRKHPNIAHNKELEKIKQLK